MSKTSPTPYSVPTEHFADPSDKDALQQHLKKYPALLGQAENQEYEKWAAKVIFNVSKASLVDRHTRYTPAATKAHLALKTLLAEKPFGNDENFGKLFLQVGGDPNKRVYNASNELKLLSEVLGIPKGVKRGKLDQLLSNTRTLGSPDIDAVRKVIWSKEGKGTELYLRSFGYNAENKTTGFYITEFSDATISDSGTISIKVAEESKDNLQARLEALQDEEKSKLFKNFSFYDGVLRFNMTASDTNPDILGALSTTFQATIKDSEQAADYAKSKVATRGTKYNPLAVVTNVGGLLTPIVYGAAWASSKLHLMSRKVPVLGDVTYGLERALMGYSKHVSNHADFLPWNNFFKAESQNLIDEAIEGSEAGERNFFAKKFRLRKLTQGPVSLAVGAPLAATRAIQIAGDVVGDFFQRRAEKSFEKAHEVGRNAAETFMNKLSYGSGAAWRSIALGFNAFSGIFKTTADMGSALVDPFKYPQDHTPAKRSKFDIFGKTSDFMNFYASGVEKFENYSNRTRHFHNKKVAPIAQVSKPAAGPEKTDISHQSLLHRRDLKFNLRVDGDSQPYALLAEVHFKGRTYKVLGGFDGDTITVVDGFSKTNIGGYPQSLLGGGTSNPAELNSFNGIVEAALGKKMPTHGDSRGISLAEFRNQFSAVNDAQAVAKDILKKAADANQNLSFDNLKKGQRFSSEGYNIRKGDGDVVVLTSSLEDRESAKGLNTNAFFNIAQNMLHSKHVGKFTGDVPGYTVKEVNVRSAHTNRKVDPTKGTGSSLGGGLYPM